MSRMESRDLKPVNVLGHPAFWAAVGLLVLNDHFLKGSGLLPGWLTGKLSDFAGLFVAPPLLALALRARTRHAILVAHLLTGFGFAALELSSELTSAADLVYRWVGASWSSVSDPTDLAALVVLPVALHFTLRAAARPRLRVRRPIEGALAFAGVLACAASTGAKVDQPGPCAGPDCDADGFDAPEDCNDFDSNLRPDHGCPDPTGERVCDDGKDDDGDHLVDCDDPDCNFACSDLKSTCVAATPHTFDTTELLTGSTVSGTSVTDGSCAGADSPEVIFEGEVTESGVLSLTVPKGHAVHVRSNCFDAFTELACGVTEGETLEVTLGEAGPVTIIVEALDPLAPSEFELPISFRPVHCGDGVRDGKEECDDGNLVADDGCSATCKVEWSALCGALTPITGGVAQGSFVDGTKAFAGSCAGSPDLVERGFVFTPSAGATTVTVSVTSSADVSLFVTSTCDASAPELGCVDAEKAGGAETLTVSPSNGGPLAIFVELRPGAVLDATYSLTVTEP